MGKEGDSTFTFNFEQLYQGQARIESLQNLERNVTEQEIKMAIHTWPNNKVPGPMALLENFTRPSKPC
jgi:hypothetical protein